ncbi:MAG: hypothetical protein GKS06_14970 [Acidobacteria bacterium]|nr:hypothetical protein [Acidobacteriota bacterium]
MGTRQLLELVERRRPEILPPEIRDALASGNPEQIAASAAGLSVLFDFGNSEASHYSASDNRLTVRGDVMLGRARSALSFLGLGVLYFTLCTWVGRGQTPGKFLCGVRVRRLDGSKLGLRGSFDRAGGYAASISTLGIGFVQAARDPNRQAIHDRIAGTVVIRDGGPGSLLARLRASRGKPQPPA